MADKIKIELGEVPKTLLIPLWGRAKEYERPDALVRDKFAHDTIAKLDYDFESLNANMPAQVHINCAIRARHIDTMLLGILEEHPDATIISIGSGLDTTFQRVDNGKLFWYDLDLEDSMALRRQLIPEGDRNVSIAKSVFDRSWFNDIKVRRSKIVILAAGVFVYLPEAELKLLFRDLAVEFPGCELMFEIYSKLLLWLRKRMVEKTTANAKPDLLADFWWGMNSAKKIAKWDDRIEVLDEFSFYSRIPFSKDWDKQVQSQIKVMRLFKMIKMVHLKLG